LVEKWVNFYKKHRQVLDGDIIHLRRPDGRDWDGILHVNPDGEEKGLIMLYNPLESAITREITIPVYYTGLHEKVLLEENMGNKQNLTVNRDYEITINVTIPEKGYNFFVLK
jgi:alpha-galactosidase